VFNSLYRGFPWDDLRKFLPGCQQMTMQRTKWRRNIAENFNRLSMAHERYRRQTDDRWTDDHIERERKFTFHKNQKVLVATPLVFHSLYREFPWDDISKILPGCQQMTMQCTKWRRNIAESFNRLSRAHERYRRQTDDRRQTDGRPHRT